MPSVQEKPTALQCFGRDLTALANAEQFAPLGGYEPWVSRVLQILLRSPNSRYNPVLIGLSEAEGWPFVAKVVRRIARGEVPAALRVRQVVALDSDAVVRDLPDAGRSEAWAAPEHCWFTQEELAADAARWERSLHKLERGLDPHDDGVEHEPVAPFDDIDLPNGPISDPIH
jgi:hypothetical protein